MMGIQFLLAALVLAAAEFSGEQVKEIQKIIRTYLVEEPEVLIEASQALQQKQQEGHKEQVIKVIEEKNSALFESISPIVGNESGSVNVVEFFDYQCGHCKTVHDTLEKVMESDPEIRLIVKMMPVFGGASVEAAKASLAADRQGKFAPFHDKLLEVKGKLSEEQIFDIAEEIGLDIDQLKADMNAEEVKKEIQNNSTLFNALGFRGTPSFVISQQPYNKDQTPEVIRGAPSQKALERIIAQVKKKKDR